MKFEQFQSNVEQWAIARGIYEHSTATAQLLEAISEMVELADAHAKGRKQEEIDSVGDIVVCLINFCALRGIDIYEAMNFAWQEIKDRRGRMIAGGVFVKESDER